MVYAKLPIKGFTLPAGGQTRFIVTLPLGTTYDPTVTRGIALTGEEVQEQSVIVANGRNVISFFYQNDLDFTVKYSY